MEQSNYVGPYLGSQPREVLIKELSPILLMLLDEKSKKTEHAKERNAPNKPMERPLMRNAP
jgi:hypothetical protein